MVDPCCVVTEGIPPEMPTLPCHVTRRAAGRMSSALAMVSVGLPVQVLSADWKTHPVAGGQSVCAELYQTIENGEPVPCTMHRHLFVASKSQSPYQT